MLTLKRANCHGDITIDLLAQERDPIRTDTLAGLGSVLLIPAVAGAKRQPILLALKTERTEGKMRDETRAGLLAILTRLSDLEAGKTLDSALDFRALGDWHTGAPGAPLIFVVRSLTAKPPAPRELMLITFTSICDRTGKHEVRVGHGVDLDTGKHYILDGGLLSDYRGARYDENAGEYFLRG